MKYKHIYTPVILIVTTLRFISGGDVQSQARGIFSEKFKQASNLERIISMWNRSNENSFYQSSEKPAFSEENSIEEGPVFGENFSDEMGRCIEDHKIQITKNYTEGKNIIFGCFKTTLILNILKYLGGSPNTEIKLFNGLVEFKKISERNCDSNEGSEGNHLCNEKFGRNFDDSFAKRRNEYMKIYKRALQKLIKERNRLNAYQNETVKEKENMLERIQENSQSFLSEVVRNLENEEAEKREEEKIKKEISDPKLLSLLDDFSKNYMLKLRFYPGVSARMMRSNNGGVTFDLELNESSGEGEEEEEEQEEGLSDEGSTREIKYDGPQAKDYIDDDSSEESTGNKKKGKGGNKKKKKEKKKKAKKLKKIFPYLLIPILIQMTLLPFVFKKLFFLAMKALFAGKMALILVGFNLLRNTCIKNDDYAEKIRVEHYGYGKGEEYGAWIHGRSHREQSERSSLNEEPFRGQKPISS